MKQQIRPVKLATLVLLSLLSVPTAYAQGTGDAALSAIRFSDRTDRLGKDAGQVSSAEHLRRAGIYLANRLFAEAREHWQAIINTNPNDTNVPAALLGMGRSYYVERRYEEARQVYERLAREFPQTKEGREGLNFSASSLLRMGRGAEAAARYAEYLSKYPNGERIDTAHLNAIDGYRESGRTQDAMTWVDRTRQRFAGTSTEAGAIFARLRLDIAIGDWPHAVQIADELLRRPLSGSGTSADEVLYLKAHSLQRAGRQQDAIQVYSLIPDNGFSYYGELATKRLASMRDGAANQRANERSANARATIAGAAEDYPAPFRFQILKEADKRGVDPRLVLSIMRQESQFKSGARSPSAARGLLQLTIDAAKRYSGKAGVSRVTEDSLYRPDVSIAIGSEYLSDLSRMFAGLPEAMAAAYNGGEDNVARWLARSNQNDEGVFASEVGFTESKNYVFKVMANYRAYRQLYDSKLNRR
ncbi:MAG TPA: transglycosylase SLT domain-containing protein [Pyrinomonadaceae bacterium]|nr:transglycosylase SLT domain-containing protein [Pyrinomonadaceae bacterium]